MLREGAPPFDESERDFGLSGATMNAWHGNRHSTDRIRSVNRACVAAIIVGLIVCAKDG